VTLAISDSAGATATSEGGHRGLGSAVMAWWAGLPIRVHLLIAMAIVCLIAGAVASVLAVIRANDRASVEVNATLKVAERLVTEAVRGLPETTPPDAVLAQVSKQLRYFRHIRTAFTDAGGHRSLILPPVVPGITASEPERAPAWFERLVYSGTDTRQVPVVLGARNIGTFSIYGEPADEIAEVWDDLSEVSLVAGAVVGLTLAMLYWVLGRILNPLSSLSSGMLELEVGRYGTRLELPRVKELEPIASRFNALAGALDGARAENRELLGHLINVQEDERRQIANELHDEAGPCLFGITANAGSILTMVRQADSATKDAVTERVSAILDSAERLKCLNRSRLKTLRPIAIGRVSLEELLTNLVAEFEKRYPGVNFFLAIEPIAPRYGEAVELTIYRCLQQGLTNALQHGGAKNIEAQLLLRAPLPEARRGELILTMTDDGTGIAERTPIGFGLSAMRERVMAVDGSCFIERAEPRGTRITITVPVPPSPDPPSHGVLSESQQS
jgi:two-component system sensor histidine kinase UhpB